MSDRLELFCVYDHPSDFPHSVVVRRWLIGSGKTDVDPLPCVIGQSIEEVRGALLHMRPDLFPMARFENDDPCIAEVWI